jgi:gluconolactonase
LFGAVAALALSACQREAKTEPEVAAVTPAATPAIERLDPALDAVLAPGATVEKVASGFGFLEGPLWYKGELWFSDLTGNKLHALGADGKTRVLLDNAGGAAPGATGAYPGSNGMAVDKDGSVLMTQHAARRIVRVGEGMKLNPVVERNSEGQHLNSPNDMVFGPDGALWFTDPPFGLPKFDEDPAKEAKTNNVYRYKDGKAVAMITDLPKPNGVGLSPDGSKLYVSNSGPDMFVNVYDVGKDGALSSPRKLISYPGPGGDEVPDGLKVDSLGNVWTSGPGGIRIVSPQGKMLGQIKTGDPAQANLAWGGPDWKTAYITATTNVYRIQLAAPGLKPLYSK